MPDNADEIKPALHSVVFITSKFSEEWLTDDSNLDAIELFVGDAQGIGWPVWRIGPTAYIFAVGDRL